MRHLFTVPFTADRSALTAVIGLVAQRVARTAAGGEIEVTFRHGVPYPHEADAVLVREVPDPRYRSIIDHLARPPELAERPGQVLVTSFHLASRPQTLAVWRDRATGEHSLSLFEPAKPGAPEPVIARSAAVILGVAESPSIRPAGYYLTVWIMDDEGSRSDGQAEARVEAYLWQPPDD